MEESNLKETKNLLETEIKSANLLSVQLETLF